MLELLTPAEMGAADKFTIDSGTPGTDLMERAGRAVAEDFRRYMSQARRVLVLVGPGNNGGDGYVAARHLAAAGREVVVGTIGDPARLRGDAAWARDGWTGEMLPADDLSFEDFDGIIDALFGAGLARPIEGAAAAIVERANASGVPILAVDLPSGINGESGRALGSAIRAIATSTFFRRKPGHLLLPGRLHCGEVAVHDIGILPETLATLAIAAFENRPALWRDAWSPPRLDGHKYARGHAVVVSGPAYATGAARLAAGGALRAGAGLVTVASPPDAVAVNAAHLTAIMVRAFDDKEGLADLLVDARLNAVAIGPGLGVGPATRALVAAVLDGPRGTVLDADALTSFRGDPSALFSLIAKRTAATVLTPHEGEFARLFPDLAENACALAKQDRAREAARRSGAVIIIKGADTVIVAPDRRVAINDNAPAWLATAGAGDVLAGIVVGLLAQKMPAFEAAAMAVWLHGAAAASFGPGMIAEDLAPALPAVFSSFVTPGEAGKA